ncbi:hypothetical protein NUU61_008133 [Penicillium alfredii]|uniref:Enoyl reductase (ER) domain-containing protein n=1 Tax=Penicillium alfredii TaxID=1506179 RepID=A0A9W9ERW9_9EURO|nr:uncharacterized protein NUU61_008133 [Penicillium alfredii]KAJ5086826.1 hypothetical protein NUU61_008133 [Penicillium alfredii]
MRSLNISSYSKPSEYQVSDLPKPELHSPKDVLVKVYAASINPIDVKRADGALKLALKDSEFVTCAEEYIGLKPPSLSFEEAASIPLAAMTALQALRKYRGDLAGKTVFVPAGCSNPQISTFLIDFANGFHRIVSVSTLPSGDQLQSSSLMDLPHRPKIPMPFRMGLNLSDQIRKLRARRYNTEYSYMFLESSGKDLDDLRRHVEEGRLRTIVGTTVDLQDTSSVRNACDIVYSGRGGLGKVVIRVKADNSS